MEEESKNNLDEEYKNSIKRPNTYSNEGNDRVGVGESAGKKKKLHLGESEFLDKRKGDANIDIEKERAFSHKLKKTVERLERRKKQKKKKLRKNPKSIKSEDDYSIDIPILKIVGVLNPAPDAGWGYAVIFAAFMVHFISDGINYTFGIFFQPISEEFKESKGKTSLVASLMTGMVYSTGPIAGALTNKFGPRKVSSFGAFIAFLGFFLAYFAKTLDLVIVCIGLLGGVGLGMFYLPAIVTVTSYFDKRRALATGIAVSGSGFGIIVLTPFIAQLNKEYNWKVTILVMSSMILFGLVYIWNFEKIEAPLEAYALVPESRDQAIQTFEEETTPTPPDEILKHKNYDDAVKSLTSKDNLNKEENKSYTTGYVSDRPDTFFLGNVPLSHAKSVISVGELDRESVEERKKTHWFDLIKKGLVAMLNLKLMKNTIFVIFLFSNILSNLGYAVPYIYLIDAASDDGVNDKESLNYLLSIIGGSNIVGRAALGYFSDKPYVNRFYLYISALFLCGLTTIGFSLWKNLHFLRFLSISFGITTGIIVGLTSVILVDLLGIDNLTNAFGLVMLFQGIATLTGPPFVGFLYDQTGSYVPGFCLAGGLTIVGGLILFRIKAPPKNDSFGLLPQQEHVGTDTEEDADLIEKAYKQIYKSETKNTSLSTND